MATKIPGYHGQLLDIDLTSKTVKKVDLDPQLAKDFIGGRAMGGKMLLDAYGTNWAKIDPLSPDALLLFMAGPYVDFIGCKTNFVFKSPQTNAIVASQGSGDFIHELRFSGYDGIIIRGKASAPVYITIFDDKVEIKDASKMWGKEIPAVHQMIVDLYGNQTSQYYIGPAGENLVRYAAVVTEWYRAAGRGGGGTVMGSKNLKAIVCKGTGAAPAVADQKKLNDLDGIGAREPAHRPRQHPRVRHGERHLYDRQYEQFGTGQELAVRMARPAADSRCVLCGRSMGPPLLGGLWLHGRVLETGARQDRQARGLYRRTAGL